MIFLFDLDGTISFKGQSIDQSIIKSIKDLEAKGNKVIFASARPIRDMLPLLKLDFEDNFFIGGNGCIIKNSSHIEVSQRIDDSSITFLKELIDRYDLDYLIDDDWNYSLKNRNDKLAQINGKIDALKLAKNISMYDIQSPIKCILLNVPRDNFDYIYQIIKELPIELVRHEGTASIDITAQNINKYTTFRKYFPKKDYIAFGNDENDLIMLQNATDAVLVGSNPAMKNQGHKNIEAVPHKVAEEILKYGNNNSKS